MDLWGRLRQFELGWSGLGVLTLAFLALLFLRRRLPENRRNRGRLSVLLLGLGPILHLVATGLALAGAQLVSSTLHLVNLFLIVLGVAGAVSLILFDLVLGRSPIPTIVRDVTQALVFGLIVFIVLRSGGFEPLSLLTTSAVATAVIGLALQNVIANLFAGLLLQIEQTFKIDDWIQIGPRIGKIGEIRWRSSTLHTQGGDVVIVPNMSLISQEVINLSRPTAARQVVVRVPFHARHSPDEVEAAMVSAARSVPGVGASEPSCAPIEFGLEDQRTMFELKFWVADVSQESSVAAQVRRRVWYAAERAGLEGPCASRSDDAAQDQELLRRRDAAQRVPLFAPLEAAERDALTRSMRRSRFGAGEVILRQGEPGDSLFVIEAGEVRVSADESAIATLGPGDCFGEMSLLTGEPRQATCLAVRETATYEIDSPALRALLVQRPELTQELTGLLLAREAALAGSRQSRSEALADDAGGQRDRLLRRVSSYFHLS